MQFVPYAFDKIGKQVAVTITPMKQADAEQTEDEPRWQTAWTSKYLTSEAFEKYAVKVGEELIAFGIKLSVDNGFGGDVVLEAKTTKLAEHYAKDFGAVKLPSLSSAAPRFIIADEAAKRIFFSYLE